MNFLLTIVVAIIGGKIAIKLKIPAGAMIGSMFAVALFNILTGTATMPAQFKILTQIATGAFIGSKICKDDVLGLKFVIKPAILVMICMAIMNFVLGYTLYSNSDLDIVTSLFATAPGGIMDMTLIANELNADSTKVVMFQLARLISVISLIPILLKALIRRTKNSKENSTEKIIIPSSTAVNNKTNTNIILTIIVGLIAGYVGELSPIPAGALSFSMIGVGVFNIFTSKGYMPIPLRQLIQMFGGALIGIRFTLNDLIEMKEIAHLILIVVVGFAVMNVIIGLLLYKFTTLSLSTSLFSSSPGGVADISIIASEMGADTPKVVVIQLTRLISIVSFYPLLIQELSKFFIK